MIVLAAGMKELDRDAPLESHILREEHFSHAARAEWFDDAVANGQEIHGSQKFKGKSSKQGKSTSYLL